MISLRALALLCLAALPALADTTPLSIYPLGDSITWGFGSGGGYRAPLYFRMADAGYTTTYVGASEENAGPEPATQHHHDGHPGYRTDEVNSDLDGKVDGSPWENNGGYWLTGTGARGPINPDIVLLHIGTNDIGQNRAAAAPAFVDQMLTKIETLRPNAHIFVAMIIPIENSPAFHAQVPAYNSALQTIVQQHASQGKKVHVADLYSRFVNADGTTKSGLLYDGVHCTQAGHNLMADAWFDAIKAVIPPQNPPPALSTPTLAYYRFENNIVGTSVYASNLNHTVADTTSNNFTMNTPAPEASPVYGTDTPFTLVPQSSAPNAGSLNNTATPGNGYGTRFVTTPANSRLNTLSLTTFTVEASFKLSAVGEWQTIIGKERTDNNDLADLYFQVTHSNAAGQSFLKMLVKQPTRETVEVTGSTPIQANRWYNAALVVDGQRMLVFLHDTVSGARTLEGSASCKGLYQGTGSWTIGRGQYGGGPVDHTRGQIDEVRISNAALAYGSLLQATPGMTGPAITSTPMTVFERVPEATNEGYQVLYSLDIPDNANWQGANQIPYLVDTAATQAGFDRVAYYLELINGTNVQWVYASMDAFANLPQQLGIPHSTFNPVKFQQPVKNMNVLSNVAGIVTGQSLDGGNVEMWPSNYDHPNALPTYAAGNSFDWGDTGADVVSGYGSFQLHNSLARQTLFAYNRWGINDGSFDDLGIGNRPGTADTDWTFSGTTTNYTSRKLVILVRPTVNNPKLAAATFTSIPANRAVVPRVVATNKATVPIAGEVTPLSITSGGINKVILRVSRNGTQISELQSNVDASNRTFSFAPQMTAELASYDIDFLLSRPAGLGTEEKSVRHVSDVVAGDVYLFYGQSNTEAGRAFTANNQSANGYQSPWVRTFGQNSDNGVITKNSTWWDTANGDGLGSAFNDPGAVGQWPLVVGRKIVDDYHIPVAILNGARGGYSMPQLQKDDAQPDNLDDSATPATTVTRTYNRLRYRAIQAGVASQARAMFYYQGESEYDNTQQHTDGYAGLRADWLTDYPNLQHFYEVQVRPGCGVNVGNVGLREAQRKFADQYANTSVMASNALIAHDGCHQQFVNGYELLGLNHYREVARDLYGAPSAANIDSPNPLHARFTDATRKRIRVTMRDAASTLIFPPEALVDFALRNTPATITGATYTSNTFDLLLDKPATGAPVLEYQGHVGAGAWITNANGVGMVSFSLAVDQPGPVVTIVTPATTQEAIAGDSINIVATAAAGPNGAALRMVLFVNGVQQFETTGNSLNTTYQVPVTGAYVVSVHAYDASENAGTASVSILAGDHASPGGVATGLRAWFKAEKGVVADANHAVLAWQDQSGNNNNVTQATAANQPHYVESLFGAVPGVSFDGNDWLTSTTGMPTGSYTKVVRFTAIGTGTVHNLVSSDIGGNDAARDHALWAPNLQPTIYHSGSVIQSNVAAISNKPCVVVATFDNTNNQGRVYVDGVLGAAGALAGPNTVGSFQLGAFLNSNFLNGALGEVLIYDRVLADGERNAVIDYLDDKTLTPFQLWQKDNLTGLDATPAGDGDHDGVSNLVEYFLGLNPQVSDAGSLRLPHLTRNGGNADVTYQRATNRPDITWQLERSVDLRNWSATSDAATGTTSGVETRVHSESLDPRAFFRLDVKLP